MNVLQDLLAQLKGLINLPIFTLGDTLFTLWSLLYILILLVLLAYLSGKLKRWVVYQLLARSNIDIGVRQATGSIVRYIVIGIGLMVILQSAGIDLSALTLLAGALGIGVGFGLQNITNNFVSGIIILFGRPIKVGDRIEVNHVVGDVIHISPRATTVVTNDNIAMIVPNSEFIASTVTNWSYTDRKVRFNIPVRASYRSDPERVRALLMEVAEAHPGVLGEPAPDVLLDGFGDSALHFILRVWSQRYTSRPGMLRSELNYAIIKRFGEEGIEIPFPQRDIHIRNGSEGAEGNDPRSTRNSEKQREGKGPG